MALYQPALAKCDQFDAEYKTVRDKAEALVQSSDWPQIAAKIYMAHKDEIAKDSELEHSSWQQGKFFDSGMYTGSIEKIFLDNAPAVGSEETRDPMAPA